MQVWGQAFVLRRRGGQAEPATQARESLDLLRSILSDLRVPEYRYSNDEPTWGHEYLWPVLQRILPARAPAPRRVFELGCGNGATARMLAGRGYDVVAVDPSESGIAVAKRHASEHLRFEVGSTAEDLRARFGRFPLAVSLEVIEHVPSALEFVNALQALLEPNGIAVISTPYHGYLKNVLIAASGRFDRHHDPLWEGGHLKFFSPRTLTRLVEQNGFKLLEIDRVGRVRALAKSMVAVVQRVE